MSRRSRRRSRSFLRRSSSPSLTPSSVLETGRRGEENFGPTSRSERRPVSQELPQRPSRTGSPTDASSATVSRAGLWLIASSSKTCSDLANHESLGSIAARRSEDRLGSPLVHRPRDGRRVGGRRETQMD
jgi:hypothetical protein